MTTLRHRPTATHHQTWRRLGIQVCYAMVVVSALVGTALTVIAGDTAGLTSALFTAWMTFMIATGFYLGAYRLRTGRWFDKVT